MMSQISKNDWKLLCSLQEEILAAACESIFQEVDKISVNREGKIHESYLALWKLLRTKDKEVIQMFDGLRKRDAIITLAIWRRNELMTEAQLAQFTPETQQAVNSILR